MCDGRGKVVVVERRESACVEAHGHAQAHARIQQLPCQGGEPPRQAHTQHTQQQTPHPLRPSRCRYCTKCTSERCANCLAEPALFVPNEKLCLDGICPSESCVRCLSHTLLWFNEPYCLKCTSEACVQCVIDKTKYWQDAHSCLYLH